MNNNKYIISADIGGSHITAAIVDLTNKCIVENTRTRLSVDSGGTWADILGTWADALERTLVKFDAPVDMIAMAMPGPFDYKNGISWIRGLDKYEAIYGLNIKQYLATELNIELENILFRNDAESFLHGEVFAGAGLGFKKIIGITLGTGLGSACSKDGITVDANRGSFKFGDTIADDYMTTRWFLKRYRQLTGLTVQNVKELAAMADTNADVQQVFKEFTGNMVLFLKDFINEEKPELLVIGGNIAKASRLFLPALKFELAAYFDYIDIKIAELGEDSSIMGAAAAFDTVALPGN
ncbi:ROK family protein [Mucilaginibacter sp. HMF5004]|uniref:ROK family protein n=1 Tax=Mucilaginibacter rivuli TaxID=2857527 RepID=UPI001C5FEA65|nr:ROK family protein [Mucilaginibacter rivuli]MBW4889742.1 ROK family protein [Mucilaginibacter rivuli]